MTEPLSMATKATGLLPDLARWERAALLRKASLSIEPGCTSFSVYILFAAQEYALFVLVA